MVFVVLMFSPVSVIQPVLYTHSLIQSCVAYAVRYDHCIHVIYM